MNVFSFGGRHLSVSSGFRILLVLSSNRQKRLGMASALGRVEGRPSLGVSELSLSASRPGQQPASHSRLLPLPHLFPPTPRPAPTLSHIRPLLQIFTIPSGSLAQASILSPALRQKSATQLPCFRSRPPTSKSSTVWPEGSRPIVNLTDQVSAPFHTLQWTPFGMRCGQGWACVLRLCPSQKVSSGLVSPHSRAPSPLGLCPPSSPGPAGMCWSRFLSQPGLLLLSTSHL